jgi:hypothetical protein
MKKQREHLLDFVLKSKRPADDLLEIAKNYVAKGDVAACHDIDIMLMDRYIKFVRNGTYDDLDKFLLDILSHLDGQFGDMLKSTEAGREYFERWMHFHDLCMVAVENYDFEMAKRSLSQKSPELEELLKKLSVATKERKPTIGGKAFTKIATLAKRLGQNEKKIVSHIVWLEQHGFVCSRRIGGKKAVAISMSGRAYMNDRVSERGTV